jgi:hypothetical protein
MGGVYCLRCQTGTMNLRERHRNCSREIINESHLLLDISKIDLSDRRDFLMSVN